MDTVVKATTGRELGTRPSRRLRREGQLPGVVYGLGKDPQTVQVDYASLRDALKGEAGLNTVFTLDVDGAAEMVIVRDIQRDVIKRTVTHADFLRVDESTPVKLTVPVHLTGTSAAVADAGAIVEQKMFRIRVSALPRAIPHAIEADISGLTMDARLAVGDLNLPEGVTPLVADRITVAAPVGTRASRMLDGEEGEDGELLEDEEGVEDSEAAGADEEE